MAVQSRQRYEFIEIMFDRLEMISVEKIVGSFVELVHRGRHYMGLCPFHQDTKLGSFIVTPDRGIWKCFACGDEYAGNGIKFVSLYKGITYLDAAFETALQFHVISREEYDKFSKKRYDSEYIKKLEKRYSKKKSNEPVPQKAHPVIIHNVYQCMKENCSLNEEHRDVLIKERMLSDERIARDYFSCPVNWKQKDAIVTIIKKKYPTYGDEVLMHVPGFFYDKEKQKLSFVGYKGLCILIRNHTGMIEGIQIRRDTIKEGEPRYIWFSSTFAFYKPEEYVGGCGCGSPKDVCYPAEKMKHTLCITEGRFKSEKLIECGNISISVQGITAWKGIEESIQFILKRQEIRNIFLFFDTDILGKHILFLQSLKMVQILRELFPFIKIRYAFWKKVYGKGIDDCIIAGNKEKINYLNVNLAEKICMSAYENALQKYGINKLQELPRDKASEFENYLQHTTEVLLGLK